MELVDQEAHRLACRDQDASCWVDTTDVLHACVEEIVGECDEMTAKKPKTPRKRVTRTAEQCQRHREATVKRVLEARAIRPANEPIEVERVILRGPRQGEKFVVLWREHSNSGAGF
jgi:hypothetical protein